jgi:hypothetical protein
MSRPSQSWSRGATQPARRPSHSDGPGPASRSARAQLALERARQEKRRRQLFWVALPVVVVLVTVATLIAVRFAGGGSATSGASTPANASEEAVIRAVTSVPAAALDTVGAGSAGITPPHSISAPALTAEGKPKVLYVGAEYCPYCAAERWAMVVALSRFGTFSGLGLTTSSATDVYPSTPTLTFHGATFTSDTISFTGVETESNQPAEGGYAQLDSLSPADQQTFSTYNQPPYASSSGSIPFVDIGGKYLISGASYDPNVLQGKTHQEIATAIADPTTDIAQAVNGTANLITAAICRSTANAPASVCTASGVQAAAKQLQ